MTLEEFKKQLPSPVKVYDKGRQENIVLVLAADGERYITKCNMGTSKRRVYHFWSFENTYNSLI